MRPFLVAVLAAVVIAATAAIVLNTYVPDTSAGAFSTQGVRIQRRASTRERVRAARADRHTRQSKPEAACCPRHLRGASLPRSFSVAAAWGYAGNSC
jgi:hypothetical protein